MNMVLEFCEFCNGVDWGDWMQGPLAKLKIAVTVHWLGRKSSKGLDWCIIMIWNASDMARRKNCNVVLFGKLRGEWNDSKCFRSCNVSPENMRLGNGWLSTHLN
jgi:hypothetical protein